MFRCGFCELSILPFAGGNMQGNFAGRFMVDFNEIPYAKAVVMENDGEKVAIVSLDALYVCEETYQAIIKRVEQFTGIKPENVMVTATHSHMGGMTEYYLDHKQEDLDYIKLVRYRAADAIIFAEKRLEEVSVRYGDTEVPGISFVRVYKMKDGSIICNPPYCDPNIVEPECEVDPTYAVMSFVNAQGKVLGMIANFACHATADVPADRGQKAGTVSADYPGKLAKNMKEMYGDGFVSLFINGPCGNVSQVNARKPRQKHRADYIGRVLADRARTLVETGELCQDTVLKSLKREFRVKRRFPTDAEIAEAHKLLNDPNDNSQKAGNAQWLLEYRDYCNTLKRDDILVRVQVVRVGDILLYSFPSELFNHYTRKLKAKSRAKKQIIGELGNAGFQYCVPPHLVGTDVFEAQPNCNIYEAAAGDIFIETGLELADELLAD